MNILLFLIPMSLGLLLPALVRGRKRNDRWF